MVKPTPCEVCALAILIECREEPDGQMEDELQGMGTGQLRKSLYKCHHIFREHS